MQAKKLKLMRGRLVATAYEAYDEIMALSEKVRLDDNPRTGIQIYIREPGVSKRNSIFTSIYHPSEDAMSFAVEKAVRSFALRHSSSQNSEDPEKLQFRGSLTVTIGGCTIQASCSGLFGDEDVYISSILLAQIFSCTPALILDEVFEAGGHLPEIFANKSSYLSHLLEKRNY
ncbi:MAG: hypothetical protein WCN88_00820 [Candidatus Falkowbacteria bacterium]